MTDFERLLADLDALEGCPRTKARVRDLLCRYAGQRIYISMLSIMAMERRTMIKRLRPHTKDRPELVAIFSERCGVSRRTAERWTQQDA